MSYMFNFVEFRKGKYTHTLIHHTIDTYSEFWRASALISEKEDSEIIHLLEIVLILEMPLQIEDDDALWPVYPADYNVLDIRA